MKFLKYLLIAILALVLFFVLIGFVKPTVEYGHKITVNKSVKEAWAIQQDETLFSQWLAGFKSIDHLEGIKGEPGSTYKVVVNPGEGQPDFEMIETLNNFKEFEFIDLSFDSDMMEFDQQTYFEDKEGKTTIKTNSKVKGKGLMMRSMFACMEMFTGSFQKQEEMNINALKKVIEENKKDYFPVIGQEIE